jgi:hypothetical protein|nr:MAG TPA: hypothetical protein [Crassvirales sp.]
MDLKEYTQLLKHNKYKLYKHIGNNLIKVGDIYANTVEEAEHLALLNHIKYDIITVTEFLK